MVNETVQQLADVFIFLHKKQELLVLVVEGYHLTLVALAKTVCPVSISSVCLCRALKSCLPWELRSLAWNVALVLWNLSPLS